MDLLHIVLLAAVGVIAGFLNTMAGGGSLLVLPALVFMGMDGPIANGTNRIAVMAQTIASVAGFSKKGYSDARTSLSLSLCTLPGAALGAYFGTKLGGELFNRVLGGLMILLMMLMARNPEKKENGDSDHPRHTVWGYALMTGIGLYGGFIQAGVGFFLMAVLHRVMGLDLVRVNMHKVFIVGVYTLLAIGIFAGQRQIMWVPGIALAAGNATGGWMGAHFAVKKGEGLIRVILYAVLAAMAVKLLI